MDSDELTEWIAFYQLEPWGESWKQTGVIASTAANIVGRGEDEPPFTASDFMPQFEESKPAPVDDMAEKRAILKKMLKGTMGK